MVGERPLVNFYLNEIKVEGLWDTGAMISLVDTSFIENNFPDVKLHSVADFLGNEELMLTVANKNELSVKGVVILNFGIEESRNMFQIPFLVTEESISKPILGYNTIEHLITNFKDVINLSASLVSVIGGLSAEKVETMVNLVETGNKFSELAQDVKLLKKQIIYPGCVQKVRCKLKDLDFSNSFEKIVLFSPLEEFCIESELVIFETIKKENYVNVGVFFYTKYS